MNKELTILIMIIATFIGSTGLIMLKLGANRIKSGLLKTYFNPKIIFGILIYGFTSLVFVYLLKFNDLGTLYSFTSLTYIFAILLSIKILKEKMNKYKWLAILLIVTGNVIVYL